MRMYICLSENPPCPHILHSFAHMTVKCLEHYLSLIALHRSATVTYVQTVFIRIKAGLKYTQGLKYTPGSAAELKK